MMANTYDRFRLGLLLLLCLYIYPDLVFGATSFIPFEKSVAVIEGETASLVWNYTVDDRNTEFGNKAPKWYTYSTGTKELLMYDDAFASWSSVVDCPARYIGRISRKPVATLVIKNVTKNDAGNYSCEIEFNGPVLPIKAYIFLTVDDPPTSPPTKDQTIATTTTGSPQGVTTTQAPNGPDSTPAPSTGLSGGAIAGIVVGCLVFVAIVVGIIWWKKRPRGSSRGISD